MTNQPAPAPPPTEDAIAARILEAAEALLLEGGTARASTDAVARRARASKRTIYSRFPTKEALLAAVAARLYAGLRAELDAFDADAPIETVLKTFAATVLSALREPRMRAFLRLVAAEGVATPALGRAFFESGKMPATDALAGHIRRAGAAGRLQVADAELAARQFMGLVKEPLFWPELMGADAPRHGEAAVIDAAVEIFLRAYGAPP